MTALVRGVALGVTPALDHLPEAETYEAGQRVTYADIYSYRHATVVEVWDDCIEIQPDDRTGTYLVFAHELRPTEPAPRRTA